MKNLLVLIFALSLPGISLPARADVFNINQLQLDQYRGKVVYLDFWASWCKPCQKSFPWMNGLLQRFPPNKFTVIAINVDQEPGAMRQFLDKVPADFDIYHDPDGSLAERFHIEAMPTSYLLDQNGKFVHKHIGFLTRKTDTYEQEIEALL